MGNVLEFQGCLSDVVVLGSSQVALKAAYLSWEHYPPILNLPTSLILNIPLRGILSYTGHI